MPEQDDDYSLAEKNELLQTIKVPMNLAHLSSRLPKSNYARKRDESKLKEVLAKKVDKTATTRQPVTNLSRALEATDKFTSQPEISTTPMQVLENQLER